MDKTIDHNQPSPENRRSSKQSLAAILSSEPLLVGLNVLVLGGFLVYLLLSKQPEQGLASGILPPTQQEKTTVTSTVEESPTPSPTSSPTPVPTQVTPPTPTQTPSSTPTTPPPTPIPKKAEIEGIRGVKQTMPLSCEASSAVDWAAYFGMEIDEKKFFAGLPSGDNPEIGFVGDVYGSWGQIPPNDYGVHAAPIAQRLREYGLNAKSVRHMTLEELKAEIAAGRPVILWVVGHVRRGTPVPYQSADGEETIVAKYEHTVIAIGYTESKIKVLDGSRTYYIYQGEFMKSWNVLQNQAIIWID
jgi:uncharacterized protein YvpB